MRFLSFVYRFVTNFAFLATVYLSLNYIEKYNNRAILAIAILLYAGMRAAIAVRSFYFFQRIERLEIEARRVIALMTEGPYRVAAPLIQEIAKQTQAYVGRLPMQRGNGELAIEMPGPGAEPA